MYMSEAIVAAVMWLCFTALIIFSNWHAAWLVAPAVYSFIAWSIGLNRSDARQCALADTATTNHN